MAGQTPGDPLANSRVVLEMVCNHGDGQAEAAALRAKAETLVWRVAGWDFADEAINTLNLHGYSKLQVVSDHWSRITAKSYAPDDPDLEVECDAVTDGLSALVVWVCENRPRTPNQRECTDLGGTAH
jgi:hypothetical protein